MPKPSDLTYIHGKPGWWHDYWVFLSAFVVIGGMTIFVFAIDAHHQPKPQCPPGMTYIPRIEACLAGASIPTLR